MLYVVFCTIMVISRQKEARSRGYALLLFQMTLRVLNSAQYHRHHCTVHALVCYYKTQLLSKVCLDLTPNFVHFLTQISIRICTSEQWLNPGIFQRHQEQEQEHVTLIFAHYGVLFHLSIMWWPDNIIIVS